MSLKEWKKAIQYFAVGAVVILGFVAMPFDFHKYDSYGNFCKVIFAMVVSSYGLVEWIDNKQRGRIKQKQFEDHLEKLRQEEIRK